MPRIWSRALFIAGIFLGFTGSLAALSIFSPQTNTQPFDELVYRLSPSAPAEVLGEIITPEPTSISTQEEIFFLPTPQPQVGGLLSLINQYREEKGMSALSLYQGLCEYARSRVDKIMNFSHEGFMDNFKAYCPECSYLGENLAQRYTQDSVILEQWLGSDAHRPQIEGDWRWGCVSYFSNTTVSLTVGK